MHSDTRRITIINRDPRTAERDWDLSSNASSRLLMLESFTVLRYTLSAHVIDLDIDVDRVILDKAVSPAEYLSLLASLPSTFNADIVLICEDETTFISSKCPGGDRVLYQLSPDDLRFYLEANGLVTGQVSIKARPIHVAA